MVLSEEERLRRARVKRDLNVEKAKLAEFKRKQREAKKAETDTEKAKMREFKEQKRTIRKTEDREESELKKAEHESTRRERYSERQAERKDAERRRAQKEEKREVEKRLKSEDIITKARLKRINPIAFKSSNAPKFSATGQEAQMSPEQLDVKQRKESKRQLGELPKVRPQQNFVQLKPLVPNSMDRYQDAKIQERSGGIARYPVKGNMDN